MTSRTTARHADRALLALKPSSPRGDGRAGKNDSRIWSESERLYMKAQDGVTAIKPWANQPWPLIEMPSRTQHVSHPALHIANEIAHIHNAMLRGLNSICLQAPHVRQTKDIADLLFLTQSWSTWLLDHHNLKESTMLPGFEAALGVPAGTLTISQNQTTKSATTAEREQSGSDKDSCKGDEDTISFLLHRVYAYASTTHKEPQTYDAAALQALLTALGDQLVPHLTKQVKLMVSMREMCFGARPSLKDTQTGGNSSNANNSDGDEDGNDVPGPLPIPMVTITRTPSHVSPPTGSISAPVSAAASPPTTPMSSTFPSASTSTTSISSVTPPQSPPSQSLSLFPTAAASPQRPQHHRSHTTGLLTVSDKINFKDQTTTEKQANKERLVRARTLLEATDRANKLTKTYLAAEARATATMDRFVVLPMIVRLRDTTTLTTIASAPSPVLSRSMSYSSLSSSSSASATAGGGGGIGGDWPRLSIPAVHAVADKLSPRHEGAWRFLPCDVWGRPRALPFSESESVSV